MQAAYLRSMAHWATYGTIPEWVANKKKKTAARIPSPAELVGMGYTVAELAADFLEWAADIREYSKHEVDNFRCALKPLVELFGEMQAAAFTSREMIELAEHRKRKRKNSGKYINQQQGRTRRAFRYAAGKKMIPASVLAEMDVPEKMPTHHADGTPEIPEVLAVDDKIAEATLEHLPEYAADFLRVMRGCGARQAELRGMLAADLVKESPDLWSYTPAIHKTSKRRKTRTLYFGRPEIAILKKRLRRLGPTGHVFTKPRRDVRQNPKTGQMYNHDTGKREHLVPWGPGSLQRLVLRANRRLALEHWTAHQLRHALGSQLVNEGAQIATVAVLLGHADTRSTERYWTPDHQQARELAAARRPK